MQSIHYVVGDATDPQTPGPNYILHVCNLRYGWGAGFTGAVSKRWKSPEQTYRRSFTHPGSVKLGDIQIVSVGFGLYVVNMIAQEGFGMPTSGIRPFRPAALKTCLEKFVETVPRDYRVHMPHIGCGLGLEKWQNVEPIIQEAFWGTGVQVYIYDFSG